MRGLLARRRNVILLVALLVLQLLLVGQQIRDRPVDARLNYWSSRAFWPFQVSGQWVFRAVSNAWSGYVGLVGTAADNHRLDAEVSRLRLENYYLQQRLVQARGRAELDEYRAGLASHTLAAKVIARGPTRIARELFLDRGRDHGVRPGMAVVVPTGIVGKVEAAHGASSMVLLVDDAKAGVGALLGQSGALGVLRGMTSSLCRIDYVPPYVAVRVGEQVYTSGLDGIFPPGVPVGEVVSVETTPELRAIAVSLHTDLDRVRDVAVVLRAEHESLPDTVQMHLARLLAAPEPSADDEQRVGLLAGPADHVKLTYRRTLESQDKKIGLLGQRPPDFSAATDSLRAAKRELSGVAGEAE